MALSDDQKIDMQGDLGIDTTESVFTNVELDRLFTRAESDYGLAVYYAYRQLLADANKFHDYSLANTSVKRSQMRAHVRDMVDFWKNEAKTSANQVLIVGGLKIPPRRPDLPNGLMRRRSRYEVNRGL